jgi:hypothetical protein
MVIKDKKLMKSNDNRGLDKRRSRGKGQWGAGRVNNKVVKEGGPIVRSN